MALEDKKTNELIVENQFTPEENPGFFDKLKNKFKEIKEAYDQVQQAEGNDKNLAIEAFKVLIEGLISLSPTASAIAGISSLTIKGINKIMAVIKQMEENRQTNEMAEATV